MPCASNVLIEDILRHEWNYPGVIIADLRDMGTEPCRSPLPVDSFKAGCDLVLLGKMALTDVVCVLEGIAKAIDGQALDAKVVAFDVFFSEAELALDRPSPRKGEADLG